MDVVLDGNGKHTWFMSFMRIVDELWVDLYFSCHLKILLSLLG